MRARSSSMSTEQALHDGRGVAVVQQRQQQVLERRVLVVALVGVLERAVQGGFQAL